MMAFPVRFASSCLLSCACACSTAETGFIDLGVASAAPAPKQPACTSDDDCTDSKRPHCNAKGICVECLEDDHCSDPEKPHCSNGAADVSLGPAALEGRCLACLDDADCSSGEHCSKDGTCQN